jgi:predicted dienelactone hydrolase
MRSTRRRLLLAASSLLAAHPAWADPVQVTDEAWADAARQRDLPLRIRFPAGAAPSGGWPVVLFSHGLGGSREGGAAWGEAWAAAGLVAVHLQHPGSDTPALRAAIGRGGLANVASVEQWRNRVADVRFVLDEIGRRHAAGAPGWRSARPNALGMSGHSFGAHTTLAMAGQRFPAEDPVREERLAAFVAFSPSLPAQGNPIASFAGITRPMLSLTGTRDEDVIGNGSTPERRAAVYDAFPAGRKAMLLLHDADHMTFGGQAGRALWLRRRDVEAARLESQHHRVIAGLTTDWWLAHLANDAPARARLAQPAGLGASDRWVRG